MRAELRRAKRLEEAMNTSRRLSLRAMAVTSAGLALPTLGLAAATLPAMTEGPFYPSPSYRSNRLDWDADLTRVAGVDASARGELLDLGGRVLDNEGRIIDGAEIEIWQCDSFGSYRHPRGAGAQVDEGFQGFGSTRSDAKGLYRFRTIRPVPYPGRTPHIHVKLRHPAFGELTSQLFVAGDAGNPRDGIWSHLSADGRRLSEMTLVRAPLGAPVMWMAEQALVAGR